MSASLSLGIPPLLDHVSAVVDATNSAESENMLRILTNSRKRDHVRIADMLQQTRPRHVIHGLMQTKCDRKPFDEALAIVLEDAWWWQVGRNPRLRWHADFVRRQRPMAAIPEPLRGERRTGTMSLRDAVRASEKEKVRKTLQRRRQRARRAAEKAAAAASGGEVATPTVIGDEPMEDDARGPQPSKIGDANTLASEMEIDAEDD